MTWIVSSTDTAPVGGSSAGASRRFGSARDFAICVETGDYDVSLERWKVYRVLPDPGAEVHHQLRIVDESGEDYLYPEEYFRPVELPPPIAELYFAALRHDA